MTHDADEIRGFSLQRSRAVNERLHALIPGGGHTYANGDDQFPKRSPR